jgi:hypothetical protein
MPVKRESFRRKSRAIIRSRLRANEPDENKRKQNEIASIGGFYFDHTDEHFVARCMAMPSCTNFGCVFIARKKTYKALVACAKVYPAKFIPHHL